MKTIIKKIFNLKPIIHFITNYVTVNACANITLAVGGSPIMADEIDEVEEVVNICNAVVLNIGTINKRTLDSMLLAGKTANKLKKTIILDPCGVGATKFRKSAIKQILSSTKINVIKGNYDEICAIYDLFFEKDDLKTQYNVSCGVDSNFKGELNEIIKKSKLVADKFNCIVCATGKTDIITDGKKCLFCNYGNKIMSKITGCGCMLNGVIACCCAVENDFLKATYLACCIFEKKYKKLLKPYIKSAKTYI